MVNEFNDAVYSVFGFFFAVIFVLCVIGWLITVLIDGLRRLANPPALSELSQAEANRKVAGGWQYSPSVRGRYQKGRGYEWHPLPFRIDCLYFSPTSRLLLAPLQPQNNAR